MRELSLFSGAGGGLLGTYLLGWRPVGYVEFNDYCQRVIAARIRDGILPDAPIYGDIRTFLSEGYASSYQGMVDIVTGGFPCQPFSVAGKQLAADDPRNMWPATVQCLRVVRPRYALLENVPGLLTSGYFGTILGDLAESGYDAKWRVLSAAEMGAPHKRDRLWIVAYSASTERRTDGAERRSERRGSESTRLGNDGQVEQLDATDPDGERRNLEVQSLSIGGGDEPAKPHGNGEVQLMADTQSVPKRKQTNQAVAFTKGRTERHEFGKYGSNVSDSNRTGCGEQRRSESIRTEQSASECGSWWGIEPDVGRVAHGVAARVDRLRALGNGQVPAVVRAAWLLLTQEEETR